MESERVWWVDVLFYCLKGILKKTSKIVFGPIICISLKILFDKSYSSLLIGKITKIHMFYHIFSKGVFGKGLNGFI